MTQKLLMHKMKLENNFNAGKFSQSSIQHSKPMKMQKIKRMEEFLGEEELEEK